MYVAGCTELEVKSTEEAFEVFWRGKLKCLKVTFLYNTIYSFNYILLLKITTRPKEAQDCKHSVKSRVQQITQRLHY